MRIVGISSGTTIYAPDDSYFSFYNSPYISHGQGSSVDIYPSHQSWNDDVVSPVSGKIVRIKKMTMGRSRNFPTEDYDYGIAIQPDHSQKEIVRILHCEPTVSVHDQVDVGDVLGHTLRSRFFNFWTGPHYHVEVMAAESFTRSSQSYPFDQVFEFSKTEGLKQSAEIEFEINEVTEDYVKGFPRKVEHATISDLVGLAAMDEDDVILGILDGGLSHYRQGGVVGGKEIGMNTNVFFASSPVGTIKESSRFLRGPSITSYLDGCKLRGLSCFVYPMQYTKKGVPPLVLVPEHYDQFGSIVQEGDVCQLQIASKNNTVKAG
jgi:murein DD-endopeptidase MepM/ murein hydrolase activator NlpD